MDLDGANPTVIIPTDGMMSNFRRISDVRIDADAEKLYWTYEKTFRRSNLDGSQQETLFTLPEWVSDFQLDPRNGKIYWTSWIHRPNAGTVNRANFDGTEQETLVSEGLWGVYGLALDLNAGKMYFSDYWTSGPTNYDGTIRAANLDGSMIQTILNLGPSSGPHAVAIDTQFVPEPCTVMLFAIGFCCIGSRRGGFSIATR